MSRRSKKGRIRKFIKRMSNRLLSSLGFQQQKKQMYTDSQSSSSSVRRTSRGGGYSNHSINNINSSSSSNTIAGSVSIRDFALNKYNKSSLGK